MEHSNPASRRVAVIGGGILGMTAGLRLAQAGHDAQVYESAPDFGGLAASAPIGDYTWDRYYHVILMSDLRLRSLLAEIGLEDALRWSTTKTGFFTDDRFHYLSTAWDFLRFPPIGLIDKARLVATILRSATMQDWKPLEQETAIDWLTRWSGQRVVDRLWRPLLRAKLGANDEIVSAAFIWAIIARMYGARKTGAKKEMFGYVDGGYASILRSLERHCREQGAGMNAGARVREIRAREGHGVRIEFENGAVERFDDVVMTVPCPLVNELCAGLSNAERERNERVIYQGMICASMLIERPLSDCYITNLTDERLPFTAVIEMTALVDRARFDGNSLIYLPRYVRQDDPMWEQPDEEIRQSFLESLSRIHPDFDEGEVVAFQVARARHVLALSTLGYSDEAMPDWKTSIPGVYVANSAQIANGTLNVNETLGVAERILPSILEDMRGRERSTHGRVHS